MPLQLFTSVLMDLNLVLKGWDDDLCVFLEIFELSKNLWVSLFR